eukprot:84985-Pelagomonas_calceolata.AAC.2
MDRLVLKPYSLCGRLHTGAWNGVSLSGSQKMYYGVMLASRTPVHVNTHIYTHIHQDENGDNGFGMEPPEDVNEMLAMMGYDDGQGPHGAWLWALQ